MINYLKKIYRITRDRGIERLYREKAIETYNQRSRLAHNDYSQICAEIPLNLYKAFTKEREKINDTYGIASVLKQYAGIGNNYAVKAHIEHGIFFGTEPWRWEVESEFPSIILPNPARLKYLKSLKKEKYVVGPYIYYARSALSEYNANLEKERLGKTLLVFPVHSTVDIKSDYNLNAFCDQIEQIRVDKRFDSIRICIYWKDFNEGLNTYYQNKGYECVSAGNFYDPMFLSRLRALIETSSMTMSNSVGTHIAYAIALNKPHYLWSQELVYKAPSKFLKLEKMDKVYGYKEIYKAFGVYSEQITPEQSKVSKYFFGTESIKSKKELKKILDECEKKYDE